MTVPPLSVPCVGLYLVNDTLDADRAFPFAFVPLLTAVAVINNEALTQVLTLLGCEALETIEVGVVIFRDDVLYQTVFRLCDRSLRTFQISKTRFSRIPFFYVHLFPIDAERIHRDGPFLGIADILAAEILA